MPFRIPLRSLLSASLLLGILGASALLVRCLPTLTTDPPFPVRTEQACGDGIVDQGDAGEQCDFIDAAVGCLPTCRIDCAGGAFDELTGSCYLPRGVANSFREAVERCEREEAHLVTFESQRERDFVAANLPAGRRWLGLSFNAALLGFASVSPDNPGWSERCTGCFSANGLDASFPCVEESAGAWITRPAVSDEPLGVVCERARPGRAIDGCGAGGACIHPFGAKSYVVFFDQATADDARANCTALKGGLLILDSVEERAYLSRELLPLGFTKGMWIGLARKTADVWRWSDGLGVEARPNPWGEGEPQDNDAGTSDRAFADLSRGRIDVQLARAGQGSEKRPYLCEFR